jgi:16S rRNA C967 or C1407 C5-methylase (RsmB/RsmF family)
LSSQ